MKSSAIPQVPKLEKPIFKVGLYTLAPSVSDRVAIVLMTEEIDENTWAGVVLHAGNEYTYEVGSYIKEFFPEYWIPYHGSVTLESD